MVGTVAGRGLLAGRLARGGGHAIAGIRSDLALTLRRKWCRSIGRAALNVRRIVGTESRRGLLPRGLAGRRRHAIAGLVPDLTRRRHALLSWGARSVAGTALDVGRIAGTVTRGGLLAGGLARPGRDTFARRTADGTRILRGTRRSSLLGRTALDAIGIIRAVAGRRFVAGVLADAGGQTDTSLSGDGVGARVTGLAATG